MKRLLLAIHTTRVAGAERIVGEIFDFLTRTELENFDVSLAALRHQREDKKGARPSATKLGLFAILFGRFDVIHSHLFLPGLVLRIRRIFDRKMIWIHTIHYEGYTGQRFAFLKRFLDRHFIFSAADQIVAVSPSVFRSLKEFSNAVLIENQISVSVRNGDVSRNSRANENTSEIIIGTTAMLRIEKGVNDLISSFALLRERHRNVRLKIAGDGPERSSLEALTKKLNVTDSVEFLGYVDDIEQFLGSLDLFVNASQIESFGLATLEALQCSVPIIASDVGHTSELLQNGQFGVLVKRDSHFVSNLAQAMANACENLTPLREKAAAGSAAEKKNKPSDSMVQRYRDLYRYLLRPGLCMISPIVTQAAGGIQRQILLQSRELDRRGYRVFIIQRPDPALELLKTDENPWKHVTFLSTVDLPRATKLRGLIFVISGIFTVARNRHRIQIVHAHQLYSPSLIAFASKWLFKTVAVVKVTASGAFGEYQQLQTLPFFRLRKLAFRSLDRVVVLTEDMQGEVRKLGFRDSQISLIPNSVEMQAADNHQFAIETSTAERLEILYCGRISKEKSLTTLIEALSLLGAEGVSCRLRLVGGDHGGRADSGPLKLQCASLPKNIEVEFLGHQDVVREFYQSSDIFVLPSISEGMSNSLLEAMSYGLVCVVSDIPANRFVIQNRINGLLFRCRDAQNLKEQLKILIDDRVTGAHYARSLSTAARNSIAARFSVQSIGGRLCEIYDYHRTERASNEANA